MIHKVTLRSVFVLALALGLASVMVRIKDVPDSRPAPAKTVKLDPSRPLASYRVYEEPVDNGIDFLGANYRGLVSEDARRFGPVPEAGSRTAAREFTIEFGTPRIEQGAFRLECDKGSFVRPAFGLAQINRGAVVEEYLFENRRIEQLFRIPVALGAGALRLAIPAKTDLNGPVVAHSPTADGFVDLKFAKGGLAFCDASGETRLAYHTAVAIDAKGYSIALAPRYENNEIVLEVPAGFMARAEYPLVIDPWLDFEGSGTGGGVTKNGTASQRPALAITPAGFPILCWSDNSATTAAAPNNFDIYLKVWNGFEFTDLGGSTLAGGISTNNGRSFNPSLTLDASGNPIVAWEDDSSGAFNIYVKQWPPRGGGLAWQELAGSATNTGVSGTSGPAEHPSVGFLQAVVPGQVTVNPQTGATSSEPPKFLDVPVVCWDEFQTGGSQIYCRAFYPGAPAIPPNTFTGFLGEPAVPAGWYQMGLPGGIGTSATLIFPFASISQTPAGGLAERPSLVVDDFNNISIAWQDTRDGNYEIYLAKWLHAGFLFQIVSTNQTRFDMLPNADFVDISGSATSAAPIGGISRTGTPSQFPSLAVDDTGIDNLVVAWQETILSAIPNTADSAQVYVARSVNNGAWNSLPGPGPNPALGVSRAGTGFSATFPSVGVGGRYVGVAWADDTNGRSSIYVRRFFLGGGGFAASTQWEQVGFQGSAFPIFGADTTGPINGVSQSNNFAFQPQLKMDFQGSPIVAWADGSGSTFDILMRVFSPNGPGIADLTATPPSFTIDLRQTTSNPALGPALDIPVAAFSATSSVFLSSRMFTESLLPAGARLRLELEIQPAGAAFTFSPTHQTLFSPPDSPTTVAAQPRAVLEFAGLPNANYHWQARTVDQIGRRSPWIAFGETGGVSFRINSGAGGGGPPNVIPVVGVGGSASKGSCGLTGLEAVALLGALALIRRRRAAKK